MKKKKSSLRKQFSTRLISIFLVMGLISSVVQLYFMNKQIDYEIEKNTIMINESISHGIKETDLAAKNIEYQIDLKIIADAKHIDDLLNTTKASDITNEQLIQIKQRLNLTDISIISKKGEDYIVVKATDPAEIGYQLNQTNELKKTINAIFNGENPIIESAYTGDGMLVLPILSSDVHPGQFFKYAYYHPEGADFLINPYIEADDIEKFTLEVGPGSWIKKIMKQHKYIKDITVLDPKVFQNPNLENQLWPPLKKVIYGSFQYQTEKDIKTIMKMAESPAEQSYVQSVGGKKVLKLFYPIENEKVISITLDYKEMTGPLVIHSIILFTSVAISILFIFLLMYRSFERIYGKVQQIVLQITSIEYGDLTAKSTIHDGSEIEHVSESLNRMVDKLNKLVLDMHEQATKTQKFSALLEAEASQSLEKLYEISTNATIKSREQLYDITAFLDEIVAVLTPYQENRNVQEAIEKIDFMREVAKERTSATTTITISLSDLLKSLYIQSGEISDTSNTLLDQIGKFKL
ncbi:methyl-accepting chemotaxis protein [Fredinandcohnia quinoae]|uniref:Methyl-accepting chemotaxis protein n=1 Tax=Fredinandcohnia quinoae TaxID=2918902 RepID=A0AAW5E7D7_9BACI|nr:methyl-accepting chemotaxis protein [Fredinandcohnia sp. SECRCQ15]MCH1625053.1 methyl-accepting chemotaxis protein [Fredinandcohnia sp. SECRCQ15]